MGFLRSLFRRSRQGTLGLPEVVAMGIGGMVSGGIYAVLGVAMSQAGNAVPISYLVAGLITLVTAYSYLQLTLHFGERGGVFSFVEHVTDSPSVAAYVGWVLVVGYVGVMAMYAFAFGAYTLTAARAIAGVALPQLLRPVISVLIVAAFVGLNLQGVEETGLFEDIAVYIKIVILLSLATLGIVFYDGNPVAIDFFDAGIVSPITGFAIIFVSYEGFQLLVYDYEEIEDVERVLPLGMYVSICIAILIYVSVSFMATLHLTPEQLVAHEEVALAEAVAGIPVLGAAGFVLVVLSAMKSTSSGINATLFGTSRLVHEIATEGALPRLFSFRNREGIPVYSLVIMGGLTAAFAALGSLKQITEFGSVAFLASFAITNYTNLRLADETGSNRVFPALGLLGTTVAIPIVLYHLYRTDVEILLWIVGIFVALFLLEFLYLERSSFEPEVGG
ncbi:L-asparagine transporter [Halorientalis persicus]|uniref:L-asparagine transporter n=1 Tax=Halorientalis persicus TaxID=1367881 RepID=A0A1H8LUF2_9EURY|nr:APC family permease [Halorientalis persicus]SEO08741.1 L-asparagine transporter [Halorientalis persicus]